MVDFLNKTNLIFQWISIHVVITTPFNYPEVTFSLPTTLTTKTTITGTTTG